MQTSFESAWQRVHAAAGRLASVRLDDLAAAGHALPGIEIEGMFWDCSRQHVDAPAWGDLLGLAHAAQLPTWRERLFSGAVVNPSENQPAVHTALRGTGTSTDAPAIAAMQARIAELAAAMRARALRPHRHAADRGGARGHRRVALGTGASHPRR